jgi:anti-anti-sigma factor
MSITNSFTIEPVTGKDFHYDFIGSIDANSADALNSVSQLPAECHVLLDFSKVERVNSMGLSLLLKLFEQWEGNKIKVEIQNLNRMINMLFKITGLGRFVKSDATANAQKTAKPILEPEHTHVELELPTVVQTKHSEHEKLNFVASLQSGHQLTGWYLLNTYLQRRMKKAIHFEQSLDTLDGYNTDLLFAKPFEACSMIKQYGFVPVLRPIAEADEVVILTRVDETKSLNDYEGVIVATATECSFVYLLGRFLCDESGIDSSKFIFEFAGNEIKALQLLIRRKCDLVFMLKKTYEGLSSFSRNNVRKLDESVTDFACHLFCVAPHLKDGRALLSEVLLDMEQDEQGHQILEDIQIEGWSRPEQGELQMLQMVYNRYVN